MKRILFASLVMLTACATWKPAAEGDFKVFNAPPTTEKAEFTPHTEEKPFKAYLAMNLPYAPYQAMHEQLQKAEGLPLITRGEAHITVITPVEYDKILKKHLSIAEIHRIAEVANIQDIPFKPLCIGRGQKEINGKIERTYFLVVESPGLIDLRGQIEEAYMRNGGQPQDFIPERLSPHITLGFTARDLHVEDAVAKNRDSCLYYFR